MSDLAERRKEMMNSLMRDSVYAAAVEILTNQGVDGLTMDRVAETAGVAKGSLYNYFASKRDLINFIYGKTMEPTTLIFDEAMANHGSASEKLEGILRRWFEYFATNRGIFDFLFKNSRISDVAEEYKQSCRTKGIADLTVIFEQGIAEGTFRPVNALRAAEVLLGAVIVSTEQQLSTDEHRPAEEWTNTLLDLLLNGLKP
ncbi:MAG: TetR/AcrR family transcriptional regulator [Pirellulales bacterium]|nr:TetR/AcrR family transcriptional regulator [Pirellulales bacterium]